MTLGDLAPGTRFRFIRCARNYEDLASATLTGRGGPERKRLRAWARRAIG